MNQEKFSTLWHTIKYLHSKQIYYRIYYKFFKISPRYLVEDEYTSRLWNGCWDAPGLFEASMNKQGEFSFLGIQGVIKTKKDWNDSSKEKLWLYHLHYLHDLNSIDADKNIQTNKKLIEKWIIDNPPMEGLGWEPYPLSLRIVNLVKWFSQNGTEVKPFWLTSLGVQAQALSLQIEYHILGNHLFANGKALIFAGSYLSGDRANFWLQKGLEILDKEINEQFLPDGGHFELSPMYHANLIWDVCDLLNLARVTNLPVLKRKQPLWRTIIEKGLMWLFYMSHPDGQISFFNDATFEVAPTLQELIHYSLHLGISIHWPKMDTLMAQALSDSGYYVVSNHKKFKAILDIAKVSVDYQPGHGHADTLSFELSLFGQRFMVNTGTSEYGAGVDRLYQRSTAAHNTVCINNQNSSVVWSGFRVAQRAVPQLIELHQDREKIKISALHTGYKRKPHRVIHHRQWLFKADQIVIRDQLQGPFKDAKARFHFHPNITIVQQDENVIQCLFPSGESAFLKIMLGMKWTLVESYWCPKFGEKQQSKCLTIMFKKTSCSALEVTW